MTKKLVVGALVAFFAPSLAFAQSTTIPPGTGVADRQHPDYAPVGGRIGSFFLYPTIAVSANASNNVRATTTDRTADGYFVISGDATLQSNFNRHALSLRAFGEQSVYASATSENATRYGARVNGLYDISRDGKISASAGYDHGAELRTSYNSPLGARKPVRFDRVRADITAQQTLGRVDLSATFAAVTIRYDDAVLASGTPLSQRYRDLNTYTGTFTVSYRARPGISAILRAVVDKNDYVLSANDPRQPQNLDRDSTGVRIEGGVRLELTSLLYGEARIGYYKRDYADPRLEDTSGLSYGVDLLWNVTPLTSLRVGADRRIDEASSTTIAGNKVTEIEGSVDHELRRNLIVSGNLRHVDIQPLGPVQASHEIYGTAGVRLLVSRQLSFRLAYTYADRASVDRAFHESRGTLSVRFTF